MPDLLQASFAKLKWDRQIREATEALGPPISREQFSRMEIQDALRRMGELRPCPPADWRAEATKQLRTCRKDGSN